LLLLLATVVCCGRRIGYSLLTSDYKFNLKLI
jgi:hypothetical protein